LHHFFTLQSFIEIESPSIEVFLTFFHILFSNYASCFCVHLIISCRLFHFWKVMSWLNKGCWKTILRMYFHYSQLFMILMFFKFSIFFKLILSPLICKCRALIHNKAKRCMYMNLNLCWKPPLHKYFLSNFSCERIFTSRSSLVYSCELFPI
jgi:hypothetical protein